MDLPARIEQDPGRWDRIVGATRHDVSHLAGFQRFLARAEGGEPRLAVVGDADRGLAWPFVLRPVDRLCGLEGEADRDIGSFLGYVGPVTWGIEPDDPFITAAIDRVTRLWRGQGAVSAFVRFHPLLGNAPIDTARRYADMQTVETIGETVSIDCTLADAEALAAYGRVLRQEIAASRRAGVVTEHDDDWRHAGTFVDLYSAAMTRMVAPPAYWVSEADVRRLRDELGTRMHLFATRVGETIIAAGLFSEHMGFVEAHLVGVDEAYRRLSPLKVMLDDVRRWAHERGDLVLHLGSGRGGRADSLFAFKRRFSPRRHALRIGRWTIEPTRMRELTALRQRRLARHGLGLTDAGWFPAYRSPVGPIEVRSRRVVTPVAGRAVSTDPIVLPVDRQPVAIPVERATAPAPSVPVSRGAVEVDR